MAQKSYSFRGVEWDSNTELVDWQCSRCKARFRLREDGVQHIGAEHKEGTLYPRLNTSGRLRLAELLPAISAKTKSEILDIMEQEEPSVLESLGFRTEIVHDLSSHTQTMEVFMPETPSISPQLYQNLQAILLRCGPFQSDSALPPLFIDNRISLWRDGLPSASSAVARVQAVVDYLLPKSNTGGENALVLLLDVLRDHISSGDACYGQLETLARELAQAASAPAPERALQTANPSQLKPIGSADKRALVEALLACPTVGNRNTRDTVLNDLPSDVKVNIRRNDVDRVDVSNIVTACLNYTNGIHELIEAVRFYEGNSIPMQKVDAIWRVLQ